MIRETKTLNLALQGGGSHGAFTWGALDRLLAEPGLRFEGISGTSSGAMNAAVLAHGLAAGGPEAARKQLATFWQRVGEAFALMFGYPGLHPMWPIEQAGSLSSLDGFLRLTRELSPYQLNPLGHNPLRTLLQSLVDFDILRSAPPRLFISATQVRSGKMRIFERHELDIDVLLASACVPSLHHAVMIEGEPYWDGGFSGNPPIFPLIFNCDSSDVLVIAVQPLERRGLPMTADEIRARAMELSFNSAFLREMRAIALSKQQIEGAWLPGGVLERRLHRLNMHLLHDPEAASRISHRSFGNNLPSFMKWLHDRGHAAADQWLAGNLHHIGARSSVDLIAEFC